MDAPFNYYFDMEVVNESGYSAVASDAGRHDALRRPGQFVLGDKNRRAMRRCAGDRGDCNCDMVDAGSKGLRNARATVATAMFVPIQYGLALPDLRTHDVYVRHGTRTNWRCGHSSSIRNAAVSDHRCRGDIGTNRACIRETGLGKAAAEVVASDCLDGDIADLLGNKGMDRRSERAIPA